MLRLEEALPMTAYVAISDFTPADDGGIPLKRGDVVEVLDTSQADMWLVRHAARQSDVGFVVPSCLRRNNEINSSQEALNDDDDDDEDDAGDTTDCNSAMDAADGGSTSVTDKRMSNTYVAIANYDPQVESGLPLYEGAVVDVMDGGNQKEFWVIRVMNEDGSYGEEGIVPGAYLEKDEQPPATRKRRVSVGPVLIKDDKERKEAVRFREKVLKEILDTENKYVDDLKFISKNHIHEMHVCEELPEAIIDQSDVLFANLESIYEFHQKTLLPAFDANKHDAEGLANVFFKYAPDLETLYVDYCKSRPRAEKLLNRPEVTEFWEIFQQDIADPYYVQAYLIKPVQRITRYQLLLKELLKYTTRAGESPAAIESALSTVGSIIRQANDVLHVAKITGFNKGEVQLETVGKLLRHDTVTCWEGKAKGRGKVRHLFLFETILVATKVKEVKTDELEYTFKFAFKMSDAGLTETIEGNSRKWRMWAGKSASTAYQQCTFEAKTVWAKHSWVKDIRDILASQLTAMKDFVKRRSAPMCFAPPTVEKKRSHLKRTKSESHSHRGRRTPSCEAGDDDTFLTQMSSVGQEGDALLTIREKRMRPSDGHEDNLFDAEEEFLIMDFQEEIANCQGIDRKIQASYRMSRDIIAKSSGSVMIGKNDVVTVLRRGDKLYLVESKEKRQRTWVPSCLLLENAAQPELSDTCQTDDNDDVFGCHCQSPLAMMHEKLDVGVSTGRSANSSDVSSSSDEQTPSNSRLNLQNV